MNIFFWDSDLSIIIYSIIKLLNCQNSRIVDLVC